jgi:hypothetical protein
MQPERRRGRFADVRSQLDFGFPGGIFVSETFDESVVNRLQCVIRGERDKAAGNQ